jgi:hypothetical protein
VGGALLGNSVEANNQRAIQAATPNCFTENSYENRTVAYNVTYEYGGRQYTTQMPYDPGSTVRVQVSPGAVSQAPAPVAGGAVVAPPVQGYAAPVQGYPAPVQGYPAPVAVQPIVVQPYPAYPAYPYPVAYPYPYPVYPAYRPFPVGVSIGFVGVFGGHRHHRWR